MPDNMFRHVSGRIGRLRTNDMMEDRLNQIQCESLCLARKKDRRELDPIPCFLSALHAIGMILAFTGRLLRGVICQAPCREEECAAYIRPAFPAVKRGSR